MFYKKENLHGQVYVPFKSIDPWRYSKRLSVPALHSGFAGVTAHKYSLYVLVDILNAPDTKWASCRGGGTTGNMLLRKKSLVKAAHCKENPIYVFHFWELCRLSPNFRIHVSVSDLYIPRIGPPFRIGRPDPGNI
jgi:hypothetical protein